MHSGTNLDFGESALGETCSVPEHSFGCPFYVDRDRGSLTGLHGKCELGTVGGRNYASHTHWQRILNKNNARLQKVEGYLVVTKNRDRVTFGEIIQGELRAFSFQILKNCE